MLLSGGVDSTVCAALMRQALNEDQIIAIHIDNGFMRKRESENVRDSLAKIGIQVKGRTTYSSLSRSGPTKNTRMQYPPSRLIHL